MIEAFFNLLSVWLLMAATSPLAFFMCCCDSVPECQFSDSGSIPHLDMLIFGVTSNGNCSRCLNSNRTVRLDLTQALSVTNENCFSADCGDCSPDESCVCAIARNFNDNVNPICDGMLRTFVSVEKDGSDIWLNAVIRDNFVSSKDLRFRKVYSGVSSLDLTTLSGTSIPRISNAVTDCNCSSALCFLTYVP